MDKLIESHKASKLSQDKLPILNSPGIILKFKIKSQQINLWAEGSCGKILPTFVELSNFVKYFSENIRIGNTSQSST
jgi:hypothetical protein